MPRITYLRAAKPHPARNEALIIVLGQKRPLQLQPPRIHHIVRIHPRDELAATRLKTTTQRLRDAFHLLLDQNDASINPRKTL
jgi:hypothetical protein